MGLVFTISTTYFLRYVVPPEYDQITNHVNKSVLPLHFRLNDITLANIEGAVEILESEVPVTSGFKIEIDDMPKSYKGGVSLSMEFPQYVQ